MTQLKAAEIQTLYLMCDSEWKRVYETLKLTVAEQKRIERRVFKAERRGNQAAGTGYTWSELAPARHAWSIECELHRRQQRQQSLIDRLIQRRKHR